MALEHKQEHTAAPIVDPFAQPQASPLERTKHVVGPHAVIEEDGRSDEPVRS